MKTEQKCNSRLDYVDILKGIGIIIMIMGHVGFGGKFDRFIHSFHMPLFFMISGYLFKIKENFNMVTFIKRKAKSLLLPYVSYGLFYYLVWIIFVSRGENLLQPLINLFTYNTSHLPIAGAIWFLTALFFMEIVYSLIAYRIKNLKILTVVICLISLAMASITTLTTFRLPLTIDVAIASVCYYHFGRLCRNYAVYEKVLGFIKANKPLKICTLIFVIILMNGVLSFVNGYVNLKSGWHAIVPLSWLNAVIGISALFLTAMFVDNYIPILKSALSYVGRNSLIYLCLNQIVILSLIRIIGTPIGNMGYISLKGLMFSCLILILSTAILSLAVSFYALCKSAVLNAHKH